MKIFSKNRIDILIFIITFLIYFIFSNQKPAIYNHHVYIADAFLHGTFEIKNPPPWHNDVAIVDGKAYGIYGPTGAVLLLPLVAFFGLSAPEGLLNLVLASFGVVLFWRILRKSVYDLKFSLWMTVFFAFGTLQFFSAVHDQTWWYAYIVASFFILLTLNEFFGRKRLFLVGLFIGFAYGSRVESVFAFIFVLVCLNFPRISLKSLILLLIGFIIPFSLISFYNFARFEDIFENGYANFVKRDPSSVLPYGLFSINYFPNNFSVYFLKGPETISVFPYFRPPWIGMSIIFVTPAFLYIINTLRKQLFNLKVVGAWASVILMAIPSLTYFYPGWTEFGWKHSVVFTPFLVYLTALGMRGKLNFLKKFLILVSIFMQLWGVLWWKFAGWFY